MNPGTDDAEAAKVMKFDTIDELFAALGSGSVTTSDVVSKLSSQEVAPEIEQKIPAPATGPSSGVQVLGVGDLLTRMARCCSPIHGDEIVGYITRSRGLRSIGRAAQI